MELKSSKRVESLLENLTSFRGASQVPNKYSDLAQQSNEITAAPWESFPQVLGMTLMRLFSQFRAAAAELA